VIKMSKVLEAAMSVTGGRILPTSLSQVGTITKYELVNYFRSRRFFILLAIGLIISGLLTGLTAYLGVSNVAPCLQSQGCVTPSLAFYSFWWGGSITFVIVLSGIFFGGDAISGEFQNKTGYFLVGNPLRRSSIYIGKWLGALIASLIIFAIYAGITVGNGLYYFGNIPYQFGESLIFSILYLIAVLGFTFFFSSLFKTSAMSILMTAILFLFAFSLIQLIVSGLVQVEPWFIITYGSGIIGNVLNDSYPTTQSIRGPAGRDRFTYAATIPEGIAILLAYFVVTAVLGLLLFERKEFT
jgi:ABC-2 type transport system permease protein